MHAGWLARLREIVRASPQEMALLAAMTTVVAGSAVFVTMRTAEPAPAPIERVSSSSPSPVATVLVHVAGMVKAPGVYPLAPGSRVKDAIAAAGGAVDGADLDALNLAAVVSDGEKVLVSPAGGPSTTSEPQSGGKVNLNTATQAQLEDLPGVGPVLAERVIAYRTKKRFTSVRQLMEVEGFGPKKFESLKDLVTV